MTEAVAERTKLVREFSQLVEKHFEADVWTALFAKRVGKAEFGTAARALLCVECRHTLPLEKRLHAEVTRLARLHAGVVDPCAGSSIFVSFPRPELALRMAFDLHRAIATGRLRIAITTGRCNVVRGRASGVEFVVLLGAERARVEQLASSATLGVIQIGPELYDDLQGCLDDLGSCVVMAEYDADELSELSVTLPPGADAEFSSFAGLGLN